nr:immunoglobulin light chain junction region [Macaca mulatta]MPO03612.1 immunoglobulin light chain junction region [Macaca mulatta]MPO04806.1 immunoglobulin light chain junction region [Macaca mulatta]MPO05209.1 immunoglobulin light chain junction region [Macaca mulatta]MPO05947.1 immunoglobulin light chain junction region [Macaca mulatta]
CLAWDGSLSTVLF